MFPKYSKEKPRGSELLAWLTYIFLNAGLALRLIVEPMQQTGLVARWKGLLVVSAVLQWLAGLFFVANTWKRVKER